jgi:hypothetical protein
MEGVTEEKKRDLWIKVLAGPMSGTCCHILHACQVDTKGSNENQSNDQTIEREKK